MQRSIVIALLFIVGCSAPAILTPPKGPGTDWPCGYQMIELHGYCVPYNVIPDGNSSPSVVPATPRSYKL